jgi:hypothetical protein
MKELGLKDVIYDRHRGVPPPTCKRSQSYPIDAVFGPENITCWRGGYLSFDYLEGDHRGLWCNIPVEFILGYNMQHPAHAKARRLKNHDPRIRKKYTQSLHSLLMKENIYDKMKQLHTSMASLVLPTDLITFEELDTKITEAMIHAEQKCRKLKTGIVPWSPLFQKACDRVTYWSMVAKEINGERVNTRKLISLRKKLQLPQDRSITLERALQKQQLALQTRKQCKKYAGELQMEYRFQLAKAKEAEDNIPAAIHVKNLMQQENTRQLYRRI